MLERIGLPSLEALVDETVPADIRFQGDLDLPTARTEHALLQDLHAMASENKVMRSCIGMGYADTIVPPVILRNVLENPAWYTQYTPYQAEISQGRLEALLNFQTVITDLTGMSLANASLLDEATAAAEAMAMAWAVGRKQVNRFLVSDRCHPQTIAVLQTRAEAINVTVEVVDVSTADVAGACGVLVQYPDTYGRVDDFQELADKVHAANGLLIAACDLLALTVLRPPAEFGADVAIGTTQRFGVPMGYGGPHAGYFATGDEYKRQIPGRIIGVSKDANGNRALRMALQTREQHIRRDKATSNICTAQVLLAIMAGMYAVYHGPDGLRTIAERTASMTEALQTSLRGAGVQVSAGAVFDTLHVTGVDATAVHAAARSAGYNLREIDGTSVGVTFDETTTVDDVRAVLSAIAGSSAKLELPTELGSFAAPHARTSAYLDHPVFHVHRSESEMLRYTHKLAGRDLSLTTSMIPLGSCTMKLNATTEMIPVTWDTFANLHPFAPVDQAQGYARLIGELEDWLAEITGFAAVSLQPNSGAQGEFAGMLVIRAFHQANGGKDRDVCLIPTSAHGTNPASAVLAGMRVVAVKCDKAGNIDVADLRAKAEQHSAKLAALMVTYPSTHGVFEAAIREICQVVHDHGGQVYMDGANMNAQVGLCRPGDFGPDVCHLNLHKTFCIPHGGGGPGMGPIGVSPHLAPYLPGHPVVPCGGAEGIGALSAAPWGSPAILPISWVYIAAMGPKGLLRATQVAILNANYMAARLGEHYPILYTGAQGRVAHEFIMDLRPFETSCGVTVEDVAKRLMDYGFHSPTMSFPVAGTLMVEPTESEPLAELDRLCDALILIREEIRAIEEGRADAQDNPLMNAPHTSAAVTSDDWSHPYSRREAAFPAPWQVDHKFWPAVGRVDNGYGDRNLICTCPPVEAFAEVEAEVVGASS